MSEGVAGQLCFDCKKSVPTLYKVEHKRFNCNCSTHITLVHVCAKCKERRGIICNKCGLPMPDGQKVKS